MTNSRADAAEERARALGAPVGEVIAKRVTPMMAERSGADLAAPGWIYELKLDGVRILADVRSERVSLFYRKSRDATASYPEVAEALATWGAKRLVLDGEVVTFDAHGRPSFERLGQRIPFFRADDVRVARRAAPVVYIVFDILAIGERDVRALSLADRKEILKCAFPDERKGTVRLLDSYADDGRPLFELCRREQLEGLIAKRASSPYRAGTRGPDWVKVKCERDDDFVVVGWTESKRGGIGALDLATYDGDTLVIRGEVGSGIDRRTATMLEERFAKIASPLPTATGEFLPNASRKHVLPEVVVNVRYLAWNEGGRLRFSVFRGVRDDVEPAECRAAPEVAQPLDFTAAETRPAPSLEDAALLAYYEAIAPVLLPYLKDRPLAFGDKPFFVDGLESLRFVASRAPFALRITASKRSAPDQPAWLAIALDARRASLREAAPIALALREILDAIGFSPFVKTSGEHGLHVMAPVSGISWAPLGALGALVAKMIEQRFPETASADPVADRRGARVHVDTSPNVRLATLVAPYAVGGKAEPVSTPLAWDEVDAGLDPSRFDVATVAARVAKRGDPMRGLLEDTGDFAGAVGRLQAMLKR